MAGPTSLRERPEWMARPDAPDKAAGLTRYMTDIDAGSALWAVVVRAPLPHAEIVSIDPAPARQVAGVVCVLTAVDVPGSNRFGILSADQPVFAETRVRYPGEALALVVAETEDAARRGAARVALDLKPLPVVDDPFAALLDDAPAIHPGGNLAHHERFERGEVETALAECVHVHEAVYRTPAQWAAPLDTEGGIALPRGDGGIDLFVGSQAGRRDRTQLARILAEAEDRFRIVSSPTGGAFGAKDELTVQAHLALAVRATDRPVRLVWRRGEAAFAAIRRHAYRIRARSGADADGRVLAHKVEIIADTGAYASLGPTVLFNSVEHAGGPYRIAHLSVDARLAHTNNGVAGACRGFGVPQISFATERQLDGLARRAGLSPRALRARNLREARDRGAFGQTVAASNGARETFEALGKGPVLAAVPPAKADPRWLTGIGTASAYQCDGLGRGLEDPCAARIGLARDGAIEFAVGLEEFGQGTAASARLQVAERLGIAPADVRVRLGDTALGLASGTTTASRGTSLVRLALDRLAPAFSAALHEAAGAVLGVPIDDLRLVPGGVRCADARTVPFADLAVRLTSSPVLDTAFGFPETPDGPEKSHLTFAYTAAACRVRVDRVTGRIHVTELDVATHCGPVADPLGYQGQMEGAAVMALGWSLLEDAGLPATGCAPTNFDGYALPGFADAPRLTVLPCEQVAHDDPHTRVGGAGEIGFDAVAPAIAAAVSDALGVEVTELPIRPAWVLARLAARVTWA